VYDSVADRVLVYCDGSALVEYDPSSNSWQNRQAVNTPSQKSWSAMAYDSESQKTILFGGVNMPVGEVSDETWVYDYKANAWTKMAPVVHPPAIIGMEMAYDIESDRVILWGGYNYTGTNFDTSWSGEPAENLVWTYDYNADTWEKLPVVDGPAIVKEADVETHPVAMDYAPDLDRVFVCGFDFLYTYDYNTNTWEKAQGDLIKSGPGSRINHDIIYLPTLQRLLVFGGMRFPFEANPTARNDTWLYDPQTGKWTQVGP
jgi:hypothetical protein